ncbi:ABC transporter permease [Paenibacillus sp. FSL W8-0426]|uniref:ABC transporter permease n=1 Tax=Paenibacillus sp. FSL W8-0426 TaxID=2921714 RepID=UPI0030DA15F6
MIKVWHICIFELQRILRMRSVLINLFILPLLLIFILGAALSGTMGSEEVDHIDPVRVGLVLHEPDGTISQTLNAFVATPAVAGMVKPRSMATQEAAVRALRDGELDFAIVVPAGLEKLATQGEQATMTWIPGKDSVKNALGETVFSRFADELNRQAAVAKVLGPDAAAASVNRQQAGDYSGQTPSVEVSHPGNGGGTYSASQYYAASMLAMFMLYSGMTAINSISGEKSRNTLLRLQAAPLRSSEIFAGKIAGSSLLAFMQGMVIVLMTYWLYDVNWGMHPMLVVLVCLLITVASMVLGVILSALFKSAPAANAALQTVIIAMTFVSGGFTPIPVEFVQRISEFTVNHWALQSFLAMMLNAPIQEILHNITMLGTVCAVLLAAAVLIYGKAGGRHE